MFLTYDVAKVLVTEHQSTLRRDATERRFGRRGRRAHRSTEANRPTT